MIVATENREDLPDDTVLIAGGGPVGMVLAITLAYFGIKSLVLERNETTTKWPKMDLTNANSMELLRKLGLVELLREKGVPAHFPYMVLFTTGLPAPEALSKWTLPSVDEYRRQILETNDGTQPQEPYQRISQSIFEATAKKYCDRNDLIDLRFSWRVTSVVEGTDGCQTTVTKVATDETIIFHSKYVAGCDGASSIIRRCLGIALDGGPIAAQVLLVHFRSRDLERLHKQGRFWHLFVVSEKGGIDGACISQNEDDIFTCHMFLPLGVDGSNISSEDAVATILGGKHGKFSVQIDEVLVRSIYRPHIAVAREYSSSDGHIHLAGDAAHQNVPTGGYGMNMGLGDAFDLGWKLAATIKGWGGPGLLRSYGRERRPVAMTCVERSGKHLAVHTMLVQLLTGKMDIVDSNTEEGKAARGTIDEYYQRNDGENKDLGIEMGQRYQSAIINSQDEMKDPPVFNPRSYIPCTYPGLRIPHVFLQSTGRSIFDELGPFYTLVEFKDETDSRSGRLLVEGAKRMSVPLKHLLLDSEEHARKVWEAHLVLVRPDFHVAWRGESISSDEQANHIVSIAVGLRAINSVPVEEEQTMHKNFTSVSAMKTQTTEFTFEGKGEMQE